jgi:hypothetical protein
MQKQKFKKNVKKSPTKNTKEINKNKVYKKNPRPICNCYDLNKIREGLDANYSLVNDINCYETRSWNGIYGFDPIGDWPYFTGRFDGNNHKITDLYINRGAEDYVGLFGYASISRLTGYIKNVGLVNADINGKNYVGALGGIIETSGGGGYPDISKSFSSGTVSGVTIVGGLVGKAGAVSVVNSYSSANVIGIGQESRTDAIGGLVGFFEQSIGGNHFATGSVSGNKNDVGGLFGASRPFADSNVFSTGSVTGNSNVGGLIGPYTGASSNAYWYDQPGDSASTCYKDGDGDCTKISDVNGGVAWFYYDQNGPMSSWGTWVNVSGNEYATTDGNWSICRGTTYPWLTWENRTCT